MARKSGGKKRSRTNEPTLKAPPKTKSNSFSNDQVYDEIILYKEIQANLRKSRVRGLYEDEQNDDIEEEVLGVDSDEDEGDEQMELSDGDEEKVEEDIEKYLPSADAWGRKRSAFYNTDITGDEYGGLSGSDLEDAELEEQEALSLQARLTSHMTDEDFLLDMETPYQPIATSGAEPVDRVAPDLQLMTREEKVEYLTSNSKELPGLISEYNEKLEIVQNELNPIMSLVREGKLKMRPSLRQLQMILETFTNYMINIRFYIWLKCHLPLEETASIANHPVIDRIIQWNKLCQKATTIYHNLRPQIQFLNKKIDEKCVDLNQFMATSSTAPISKSIVRQTDGGEVEKGEDEDEVDEARRAIDMKIAKNRGLTPKKSKKFQKHSRLKRRHNYDKAVIKRKSQVPDVRHELTRYGGEVRGIKAAIVKSRKLH